MNKLYNWLLTSNRGLHLLCVWLLSLALGWASGITAIVCLEVKDVLHNKDIEAWDWVDCLAGGIGCFIGGLLHWLIFKHW